MLFVAPATATIATIFIFVIIIIIISMNTASTSTTLLLLSISLRHPAMYLHTLIDIFIFSCFCHVFGFCFIYFVLAPCLSFFLLYVYNSLIFYFVDYNVLLSGNKKMATSAVKK